MDSTFKKSRVSLDIHMPPYYTEKGKFLQGIHYRLNKLLMKYDEDLGGVLLAYSNIHVNQKRGIIVNEQPHVHFSVDFDALLFAPSPGMRLVGKVNKVGTGHIGLLVFGVFNASIFKKSLPLHYKSHTNNEGEVYWQNEQKESDVIKDGTLLEFFVSEIKPTFERESQIYVIGSLIKPQPKRELDDADREQPIKKKMKQSEPKREVDSTSMELDESKVESKNKKLKKEKKKEKKEKKDKKLKKQKKEAKPEKLKKGSSTSETDDVEDVVLPTTVVKTKKKEKKHKKDKVSE